MTKSRLLGGTAPIFRVGGQARPELSRDLTRLDIEEDTAGLRRLSARFIAVGRHGSATAEEQLYLDGEIFDFGSRVEVSIGPSENERTLFDGVISAISADFAEARASEVTLSAEDKLMDLRMTRRHRSYRNVSDGDIAREIASRHGLSAQIGADGPTYDVVQQLNMSDLAFLRSRARLIQAEVWVQGNELHFKTRDQRRAPRLTLVRGNQLIELAIRGDLAHQRTKVKVSGYDAKERDLIDEEAGNEAIQAEVAGGRTGPAVLAQAFGERVSYRVRDLPLKSDEARAWARAEQLRRARSFVTASGTTDGSPDLIVGSVLELQNVGKAFEGGDYYVTQIHHSYDLEHGHRTRFEAERATVNEAGR